MIRAEMTLNCDRCDKELHIDWLEVAEVFSPSDEPASARNPRRQLAAMARYAAGHNSTRKWRIQAPAVPPGWPLKTGDFCSLECQRLAIRSAEPTTETTRRKRNA